MSATPYDKARRQLARTTVRIENGVQVKPCPRCKRVLPWTAEYWPVDPKRYGGLAGWCRTCKVNYRGDPERARERGRRWMARQRELDPEGTRQAVRQWRKGHPGYHRKRYLQEKYRLTVDEYVRMGDERDWRCDICGQHDELCVDHDHDTERIRGLLCRRCNVGLGHFSESTVTLSRAIDYLRRKP